MISLYTDSSKRHNDAQGESIPIFDTIPIAVTGHIYRISRFLDSYVCFESPALFIEAGSIYGVPHMTLTLLDGSHTLRHWHVS